MTASPAPQAPMPPVTFPTPPALNARPHDPHRRIPVPWVNEHDNPDGTTRFDFISINHERALRCAIERRCGSCAEPLDYWVVFVGSPRTPDQMVFTDPPMHDACALAALTLCPHIALRRHSRAPAHRVPDDTASPPGWSEDKPDQWVVGYTRSFEHRITHGQVLFLPRTFKHIRTFGYDSATDALVETSPRPAPTPAPAAR